MTENTERPDYRTCPGCKKTIKSDDPVRYTATRGVWHDGCFRR